MKPDKPTENAKTRKNGQAVKGVGRRPRRSSAETRATSEANGNATEVPNATATSLPTQMPTCPNGHRKGRNGHARNGNGHARGGNGHAHAGNGHGSGDVDSQLVHRCLSGDERAWEGLYHQFHPGLVETIRFLLGGGEAEFQLIDEISARVWYALVQEDSRLLASFDARRNCRFELFLKGLARIEVLRYLRAEKRRNSHELAGGMRAIQGRDGSDWQAWSLLDEFAATLSPSDREFLTKHLIGSDDEEAEDDFSKTSFWQRRHRIRFKLVRFLERG